MRVMVAVISLAYPSKRLERPVAESVGIRPEGLFCGNCEVGDRMKQRLIIAERCD
jgi:hypothetical protein